MQGRAARQARVQLQWPPESIRGMALEVYKFMSRNPNRPGVA